MRILLALAALLLPAAAGAQEVVPIEEEFPVVDAPSPAQPAPQQAAPAANAAAAPAVPAPVSALTYGQLGSLPAEQIGERLFGEMSQILYFYRPEGRPAVPVPAPGRPSRIDFLSRPRAAEVPGICETDFVTVSYDVPVAPGVVDPPIRLRSMNVTTLSFINDLAAVRAGDGRDRRGDAALDAVCGPVDPAARPLILGRGPSARAVRALADLIDAVRAARPVSGLQCQVGGRAACLRTLATLRVEDMEREGSCAQSPGYVLCSRVTLRPYDIELAFTEGVEGAANIRVLAMRPAAAEAFRRNIRDAAAPAAR